MRYHSKIISQFEASIESLIELSLYNTSALNWEDEE